ncbi:MAG: hypothetical protein WBQ78_17520 [Gammaproteobacteria bacterium]
MENKPVISTAIPKRRYRLGEFTLTVLGDIESSDGIDYQYIMAVIQGQDREPGMYITAERPDSPGSRDLSMRLVMRDGAEVIGNSDQWVSLDMFTGEAIDIVSRVLSLSDETPYQLL